MEQEHAGAESKEGSCILVIDDDPAILDLIVEVLRDEGYGVIGARDGLEALRQIDRHRPDLILLDLWMPRMNGWEFRRRQRALPGLADVPVVLLSAGGGLPRHAAELDAAATIAKPFDLAHLLRVVEEVLHRPRGD